MKPGAGLHTAVPKKFPYFTVEWGGGKGYCQITEEGFSPTFGSDVLAGMLRVPAPRASSSAKGRGNAAASSYGSKGAAAKAAAAFAKRWAAFDPHQTNGAANAR